jgi:hypothetical protein
MAAKRPLVNYGGTVSELVSGDTLSGAAAGGGSVVFTGIATLDFGTTPGSTVTTVDVIGQTDIGLNSKIWLNLSADYDIATHNKYEQSMAAMFIGLSVSVISNGVGFTITAMSPYVISGYFIVNWAWTNGGASGSAVAPSVYDDPAYWMGL